MSQPGAMFLLDRQALAFLAAIALLTLAMVFLAPFALFALGGLGALLLLVLWLRAAIRARKVLAPFGAVEGAIALSSLLLVIGAAAVSGVMVARLGLGEAVSLGGMLLPSVGKGPPVGQRSVWYSDPQMQQRLKDELAKAGIPFTTRGGTDGKEYIGWSQEHDAAAEKIQEKVRGADIPLGIHFGSAEFQKEFIAWLAKQNIKSEIVQRDGKDHVTWDDPRSSKEMMDAFIAARPGCPKTKAKC